MKETKEKNCKRAARMSITRLNRTSLDPSSMQYSRDLHVTMQNFGTIRDGDNETIPELRNHYELQTITKSVTILKFQNHYDIRNHFEHRNNFDNSEPFRTSEFFYEWRAIVDLCSDPNDM